MRLEHHLVGGYVRYISPHIIIIIINVHVRMLCVLVMRFWVRIHVRVHEPISGLLLRMSEGALQFLMSTHITSIVIA